MSQYSYCGAEQPDAESKEVLKALQHLLRVLRPVSFVITRALTSPDFDWHGEDGMHVYCNFWGIQQ